MPLPLIAGTVTLTAALITAGLRSRIGFGRALAIGLAGALTSTSTIGLVLLDADVLTRGRVLVSLLIAMLGWAAALAWLRMRWPARRAEPIDPSARLGTIGLLVVLVVGVGVRLDPSPYPFGGQDQGIYVAVGHHVARTGRLRPLDRLLAGKVPGFSREAMAAAHQIVPVPEDSPLAGVREGRWIAGLHIEDASEGRIVPAFFHLLPVAFALCELDFGFARSTWVLVVFAGLAQLAAFALGRRLGAGDLRTPDDRRRGWAVGLIAAAALALHPLDLWISTFPVTENLARAALLGSAALAFEAMTAERRAEPGVTLLAGLAGLVFAAGAFARGSMLALAIVLALALVLVRREVPRTRRALLVTLVVGATLAAVQGILHSWPYFFDAASNHFHVPRLRPFQTEAVIWALLAGASVLLVDVGIDRLARRWTWIEHGDRLARVVGLIALGLALVAVIVRALDGAGLGSSQQVVIVLLRYAGPLGLTLGLVGLFAWTWFAAPRQRAWVLVACAIVLSSVIGQGVRYEFYYARYLIGDLVPVLIVAGAWLLGEAARVVGQRWGSKPAALGLAVALAGWWLPGLFTITRPVFWTRDLEHADEDIAAIVDELPEGAVLFFDAREPGRWRGFLSAPIFLAHGQNVLVYPSSRRIEKAIAIGTPIYMLSGGWVAADHQRWPDRGPWHTSVVARGHLRARRAEVVEGAMPRVLGEWGGPWELHRIDPSIWRSTGAFSLYPGSRFIAREGATGIASVELPLAWETGAAVELLVVPGSLEGCGVEATLVGDERRVLEGLPTSTNRLLQFGVPSDATRFEGAIAVEWSCPDAREVAWRRLGLRGERR
ncbi:hypothetical protein ACNOYE_29460 [Nannocystaceae bacterium ST9]